MTYWLFKSEPGCFSIDDLKNSPKHTTHWDGVRNYQARNFMRDQMQVGEKGFFYHSNCKETGIIGTVEITSTPYPDHTAFDLDDEHYDPKSDPDKPRWFMVDVTLLSVFPRVITLAELKAEPELASMLVVRKGNRLSITPVSEHEWDFISRMA